MANPQFSILVPTRQRPDTLGATLATLVDQPGDDYEIIVADNFGDTEVAKVIAAAQKRNARVVHLRSDRVLPMGDNWERGLAACRGNFVSVLGDDDGFLPGTLEVARHLLAASRAMVLNWDVHTYWWPDTIVHWHANRLYVRLKNSAEWIDSRATLSRFFGDPVSFTYLPMIYTAFVHRDIINRAYDRLGCYFLAPELAPDVTSGIVNLIYTDRFLHSRRPLAVRGNSRRSNGTAQWTRAYGQEQRDLYFRDEGRTLDTLVHSSMVSSPNLGFYLANVKLRLKDALFSDRADIQVDLASLVRSTIASVNLEPESYEHNLEDALRLADKIGFKVDPRSIPPKTAIPVRQRTQGLFRENEDLLIAVNCDQAGIFDVASAARLAESISPALSFTTAAPP